jgi:hypothetical protein
MWKHIHSEVLDAPDKFVPSISDQLDATCSRSSDIQEVTSEPSPSDITGAAIEVNDRVSTQQDMQHRHTECTETQRRRQRTTC